MDTTGVEDTRDGQDRLGSIRSLLVAVAVAMVAVALTAGAPFGQATTARGWRRRKPGHRRVRRGATPTCVASSRTETNTRRRSSGPIEFAGRRLEDIKGAELANVRREQLRRSSMGCRAGVFVDPTRGGSRT